MSTLNFDESDENYHLQKEREEDFLHHLPYLLTDGYRNPSSHAQVPSHTL